MYLRYATLELGTMEMNLPFRQTRHIVLPYDLELLCQLPQPEERADSFCSKIPEGFHLS